VSARQSVHKGFIFNEDCGRVNLRSEGVNRRKVDGPIPVMIDRYILQRGKKIGRGAVNHCEVRNAVGLRQPRVKRFGWSWVRHQLEYRGLITLRSIDQFRRSACDEVVQPNVQGGVAGSWPNTGQVQD